MQAALAALVRREDLSGEAMERAVSAIMDGDCTPAQIGAFLAALRTKGETTEELIAAVRAIRARAVRVSADGPVVDTCGTGGDGRGTFNVSTAAAFVAAAGGARVAKHGNRAASGRVGAADVLEALGAKVEMAPALAERALREIGICFLFAPLYHPAARHAAGPRRELGFRTLFNLTGPLCNPAGATRQVIGLFSPDWLLPVGQALHTLGSEHALVLHGRDGSDELTPVAPADAVELRDGKLERMVVDPKDFAIPACRIEDLAGGDARVNADILRSVLAGQTGPRADCVALNAGAAFYVGGHADTLANGVELARRVLASGTALAKLDALVALSRGAGR